MKKLYRDKIKQTGSRTLHESAGGFLFYREPQTHVLYVALLKKDKEEGYLIPKGHIKEGEAPKDAAIREIKEELSLNIQPRILFKLGVSKYSFNLDGDTNTHEKKVHLFVLDLQNKVNIEPNRAEGFISAQWIPLEDALTNIAFYRENLSRAQEKYLRRTDA